MLRIPVQRTEPMMHPWAGVTVARVSIAQIVALERRIWCLKVKCLALR